MTGSLRARLLTAFLLVAIPPLLLLSLAAWSLISRSFAEAARRRLETALASARGRIVEMRRDAETALSAIARHDLLDPPASRNDDRTLATAIAQQRGLDTLVIVDALGQVVSSHHWPAGFGLAERDEPRAADPPLRIATVAEGFGAAQRLALMPSRSARWRGAAVTLRGGPLLDVAFVADLGRLMAVDLAFYDARRERWIAPAGSPLESWQRPAPPGARAHGELQIGGSDHRWAAERLAPGLWLVAAAPRLEERTLERRVLRFTLMAGAAALLAALAAALLLSRSIARPVLDLTSAARRLAAGQRVHVVALEKRDEIGELARAFGAMSTDLEASRARLVQAERVAAWRDLARRLAHELKNPLFPIQLSIETLRRAATSEGHDAAAQERRFTQLFLESSDTMLGALRSLRTIVEEFSEFARLPQPRLEAIDLNAVAEEVLGLYRARAGGVRIATELDPQLPRARADRDLIARALGNLVANALEAMPEGGSLTLRTAAAGEELRIEVEDSGPGLNDEQRSRLFTPYYTTRKGGTGLGLAIVQGIVADQGGRVEVRSAPGRGSSFTLVLPAAHPKAES